MRQQRFPQNNSIFPNSSFRGFYLDNLGRLKTAQPSENTALSRFQSEMKARGFSKKTIKAYTFQIRKYLKYVGNNYEMISQSKIKEYIGFLHTHNSPKTARLALIAIKTFYLDVVKRDLFEIPIPKGDSKLPTILSKDQISSMIQKTENFKHKILISILYGCGLRASEIRNIQKEDYNKDSQTIHIRQGKGRKDRIVPVPKRLSLLVDFYLEYVDNRPDEKARFAR